MTEYDKALKVYTNIAKKQFHGELAPFKQQGLVVRKEGRYAIQTDSAGIIIPININISKYINRRVECTFNVTTHNSSFGYPVNLISITKLPV